MFALTHLPNIAGRCATSVGFRMPDQWELDAPPGGRPSRPRSHQPTQPAACHTCHVDGDEIIAADHRQSRYTARAKGLSTSTAHCAVFAAEGQRL